MSGTIDGQGCPRREQAAVAATDAACGRAPDAEFAAHAATCAECRPAYEAAKRTAEALRGLPSAEVSDLVPRVMAALPAPGAFDWRRFARQALPRAAAAVAVAGLGLAYAVRWRAARGAGAASGEAGVAAQAPTTPEQARGEAAAWLAAAQRPDGAWDVAALGGRAEHAPALTALALMALHEQGDPAHAEALRKGVAALVRTQRATGCFGDEGASMMYNHGMASTALLRLWHAGLAAEHRPALDAAVAFIRKAQQPEGGWGYRPGTADGAANASVTAWQLEALGLARQAGWGDPQGHLRRGLFWLSQLADARGVVGYQRPGDLPSAQVTTTALGVYSLLEAGEGLDGARELVGKMARRLTKLVQEPGTATAAPNPYRDYFAVRASAACAAAELSPTARPDVSALRERLVATRVAGGAARGTWDPGDAYAQVGGRLYTTSFAAMALR